MTVSGRQQASVDIEASGYTDRQLLTVSTYVHGKAHTPFNLPHFV